MSTESRWISKADAYVAGYLRTFNAAPSRHNVLTALCVAEFETRCGDLCSGNWGGTTAAQLTADDRTKLSIAGLSPSNPDDLDRARELLGVRPNMVLGQDSDPRAGWYWIWFYRPATPADGAAYFVRVLVLQRPTCKTILEDDDGTLNQLVRAMYATHYFAGHFDPHNPSVTYNGQQMTGAEADIEAYRDGLLRIQPGIVASLMGWTPAASAYDLSTVLGIQEALIYLAGKLGRPELDPGGLDDDLGPKTKAAVEAFQQYAGLTVDGDPGDETRSAIMKIIAGVASTTLPAPPPPST
jgi:Putative peptidoglycan binding domain